MALEMDIAALLSEAELAVREAGLLFNDRELAGHIHHKNKTDYVTEVDTGIQELLCRRLAEILPEARFMGEEQDNSGLDTSGLVWVLDPVDGTTNFNTQAEAKRRLSGAHLRRAAAARHCIQPRLRRVLYRHSRLRRKAERTRDMRQPHGDAL